MAHVDTEREIDLPHQTHLVIDVIDLLQLDDFVFLQLFAL